MAQRVDILKRKWDLMIDNVRRVEEMAARVDQDPILLVRVKAKLGDYERKQREVQGIVLSMIEAGADEADYDGLLETYRIIVDNVLAVIARNESRRVQWTSPLLNGASGMYFDSTLHSVAAAWCSDVGNDEPANIVCTPEVPPTPPTPPAGLSKRPTPPARRLTCPTPPEVPPTPPTPPAGLSKRPTPPARRLTCPTPPEVPPTPPTPPAGLPKRPTLPEEPVDVNVTGSHPAMAAGITAAGEDISSAADFVATTRTTSNQCDSSHRFLVAAEDPIWFELVLDVQDLLDRCSSHHGPPVRSDLGISKARSLKN